MATSSIISPRWASVCQGVKIFRDSCNVYAVDGPEGSIIINAGSGLWIDHLDELDRPPIALLCTHFFRDHSAGAVRADKAGIPVWVPETELDVFVDPVSYHQQRQTFVSFDTVYWHHFAPIEPVAAAGTLRDHEHLCFGGLEVEVVPLPGVTVGQCGIIARLDEAGTIAFCGETIHSPGRIPRMAPLQQFYCDLDGIAAVFGSCQSLQRIKPNVLLPSLGEPILQDTDGALSLLRANLRTVSNGRTMANGASLASALDGMEGADLEQVSAHVYRSTKAVSTTTFVVSDTGQVLSIDYGIATHALNWNLLGRRSTRRAVLHSLDALEQIAGRRGVDVSVVTHFHDDHIGPLAMLKRLFNTQVWACESFIDVIENPNGYILPEAWPVATPVDRVLRPEETFTWNEFTFRVSPVIDGGHTRYQALYSFEADGLTFAAVGDQYLSKLLWLPSPDHRWEDDAWDDVCCYRNGQKFEGARRAADWLLELRPDVILNGHQPPIFTTELVFDRVREHIDRFEGDHKLLMPISSDDVHFDIDATGAFLKPYRHTQSGAGTARFEARVRNPLPRRSRLDVRMVGPAGLVGEVVTAQADAHAEVLVDVHITVPDGWRRQPVALEVWADGQPFGQVAEALITIGEDW